MLAVYILLMLIGGAVMICSGREEGNLIERAGRFLHKKYIRLAGSGLNERSRSLEEELGLLLPGADKRQEAEHYIEKRFGGSFMLIFSCVILATLLEMQGMLQKQEAAEPFTIRRNAYERGSKSVELTVTDGQKEETVWLSVEPREYGSEEIERLFEAFLPILEKKILAKNSGLDKIQTTVYLPEHIEGFPFLITWQMDEQGIFLPDGGLKNESLPTEGVITNLTAYISYKEFEQQYIIPLCVYPPDYTEEELFQREASRLAREAEESSRKNEKVTLPEQIGKDKVIWKEVKGERSILLLFLGIVAAGLLYMGQEQERKKRLAARQRNLKEAYPELVTRMALLLGSGLTVRAAFRKIGEETLDGREILSAEMKIACHEMDNGISESQAYLHFGQRCSLKQYRKFSVLLTQNLKKGSKGLLEQMEKEAKEALEEQKSRARQYGEEAGTKLLIPMAGMLIVTMLLIIVPAFGGFGI